MELWQSLAQFVEDNRPFSQFAVESDRSSDRVAGALE